MPRAFVAAIVASLLWIAWCILVVTELVPHLQRHVTMWAWLMSYFFCLLPVVFAAAIILARIRRSN